ncbi:hypothetical protein [Proteiniphilum acetatigenes]|uniref:hypothetical protein n=1 Tax=Proteiniphilum acetatigenes TaxID=294710 RepID=UPI000379EF7A|nr:hypothetical protein [Proteiniphilum acetatigenes]
MRYLSAILTFLIMAFGFCQVGAQNESQTIPDPQYWNISPDQDAITWNIVDEDKLPHADDIEMSGQRLSSIVRYEVDKQKYLRVNRDIIFPQLRRFVGSSEPDWYNYRAYLRRSFNDQFLPSIVFEDIILQPKLDSVRIDGQLTFFHSPVEGMIIERTIFPSMTQRQLVEKWVIKNISPVKKRLYIGHTAFEQEEKGMHGVYKVAIRCDSKPEVIIEPGEDYSFGLYFSAGMSNEPEVDQGFIDAEIERKVFLNEMKNNLVLKSPDSVINTLFYFSKIRASESIFETKMGLVHSPGGGNYYAGVWANDQVEYSGPFFPWLGYEKANIAAYNAYKHFLKNIPPEGEFIRSSFEMEGDLPCCSKDRGDAAMISYGTSQFVLASGDKKIAEELWPLIEWSIKYCNANLNGYGVVLSDTDEMEGRIPTGDANLATSSLYYGGLVNAARVARMLDKKPAVEKDFLRKAKKLETAIDNYFGTTIDGIETYRYFDGHQTFRHWICLPLVMGIQTRKEGTLNALFDKLWADNGILVEPGDNVFWDRGTLYAFRGAFKAGAADRALGRLSSYSQSRLLGKRVPYAVEAYPEYGMRHLSAESALYCRIFTEGILGIEPLGQDRFKITLQIPDSWDELSLTSCKILNRDMNFFIVNKNNNIHMTVSDGDRIVWDGQIDSGKSLEIEL